MYRDYDEEKDALAVIRTWHECGWIEDPEKDGPNLKLFFQGAQDALVATINGEAECAVTNVEGTMRYLDETLRMGAISSVTTSRIARKQGFAKELTARLLIRQVERGHEISALGMFEQGFYDQIGFGTGSYEQQIRFDPASLAVSQGFRPPKRLTLEDSDAIHVALCERSQGHGGVTINSKKFLKADLCLTGIGLGLGYFDGPNGTLSHFIWGATKGDHGPYDINFRAYQNPDQLMELLALIKSLADQVNLISMLEFGDIQFQDLLKQPFRHRSTSKNSDFPNDSRSAAYWQVRILNLQACMAKTKLNTPDLKFNLRLSDPVIDSLPNDSHWKGIGGDFVIQFGSKSFAEVGKDSELPTLTSSVNAFTRMWLGVRPASSLAVTTDLSADTGLLTALDQSLNLPRPHLGWEF